jgi:hypothetical protein
MNDDDSNTNHDRGQILTLPTSIAMPRPVYDALERLLVYNAGNLGGPSESLEHYWHAQRNEDFEAVFTWVFPLWRLKKS